MRARFLFDALRFYVEFHRAAEGLDGCVVNDVLPIAVLLDPQVLDFESVVLAVDRADDERRGRTRRAEGEPTGAHARVARSVRVDLAHALLADRVLRWAEEPEASTPVGHRG